MARNMTNRPDALESDQKRGVVTVVIRKGETKEQALARHLSGGCFDSLDAELTVYVNKNV
jgi:hypothetical protein